MLEQGLEKEIIAISFLSFPAIFQPNFNVNQLHSTRSSAVDIRDFITDEMHPYTFFIETLLKIGCISSVIIPTTLVCVLFGPTIPTYFFNNISILVCVHF